MYSQSMPQFTKVPGYTYILFKKYLQTNVCFKLENALKRCGFFDFKALGLTASSFQIKESTLFRAFSIT